MIEFHHVTKNYLLGKVAVPALKGVSFQINQGEFVSISGPSGSGKSTILNLMGCLDSPTSGTVMIEGKNISEFSDDALSMLRCHSIGFIFQSFNLVPVLNIFENIEYPLILQKMNKKVRKETVFRLIEQVGLSPFIQHKPDSLSGGQRQRVAIARALVTQPKIVLADEPTANLDSNTGTEILELMKEMNTTKGITFVFSTHDPNVLQYANRVIKIKDGELER